MLLAIDVGNTNIVVGVFRGETLVHTWRLTTIRERTSDELGILITNLCERNEIRNTDIAGIIIASVVPPLTGTLMTMVSDYFGRVPLLFEPAVNGGIPILIDNPHEVGADRVANSIAAYARYGKGLPLIVVDFGTATTFDAVSAKGEYLGGIICPGPTLSAEALFQRAAKLPRIDVKKPPRVIGTNTIGAMQSGLFWGYVDMVEGLLRRMKAELGGAATVLATGGLASVVAPESTLIEHVDQDLTLHGIAAGLGTPGHRLPPIRHRLNTDVIDVESYCRDLEAYLCQKNDGHLIRITGPAFERIEGWAQQGIPLKVAEAGIDRYFERYYRKGARRRPVQIVFCEADVLDAFDDWRRAVGLVAGHRGCGGRAGRRGAGGGIAPAAIARVADRRRARAAHGVARQRQGRPDHRPGARGRGAIARCVAAGGRAGPR